MGLQVPGEGGRLSSRGQPGKRNNAEMWGLKSKKGHA